MKETQFSRTALAVAERRADHQIFDDRPLGTRRSRRVAYCGAGGHRAADPVAGEVPAFDGSQGLHCGSESIRGGRAGAVGTAEAFDRYIVLGAGLDTFAYRLPRELRELRIWEVDHPATQTWKRERLTESGIPVPPNLAFVPVNFEREDLRAELARAGFDERAPSFFACLGVTMYLASPQIEATLKSVSGLPARSGIVFDYLDAGAERSPLHRLACRAVEWRVGLVGEPFRSSLSRVEVEEMLRAKGFTEVRDLGTDEVNERYFNARSDRLRVVGSSGRLVRATV